MYSTTQRQLLRDFADASDQLLSLGVIRHDTFIGEIAEYLACKVYGLSLAPKVQRGYDAVCPAGKTYQVKSKLNQKDDYRYTYPSTSECPFQYLVVVWFNQEFLPDKIIKIKVNPRHTGNVIANLGLPQLQKDAIDLLTFKIPARQRKAINHFLSLYRDLELTKIVRSKRIVGDIGEYYASKKLHLTLSEHQNQRGYDALDQKGKKYEIKCRRIYESERRKSESRRINNLSGKDADFLVFVILGREFLCAGMWIVPYGNVAHLQHPHIDIINTTPGIRTVVKSKISWLKDAPIFNSTIAENAAITSRRPSPVLREKKINTRKRTSRLVSEVTEDTFSANQDQEINEPTILSPPEKPITKWWILFILVVLTVLYIVSRVR